MSWGRAPAIWLFVGLAIVLLTSFWPPIARALSNRAGLAVSEVSVWSTSSDPEREQRIAEDFARQHPEARIAIRFRESSTVGEAVYIGFLSGNPPDVMDVPLPQLDEMVANGMVLPLDDQLAAALAAEPDFLDRRLGRDLEVVRWRCNPDHPMLAAFARDGSFATEAARMLAMDGRVVGFSAMAGGAVMTWNRRVVEAAGAMFPELLGPDGRPRPPQTWLELRRHAWCVAEWSRRTHAPGDRVAGMVVQGQKPRDIMRGLQPLAATAGATGFDFAAGRYAWDAPGITAAAALLLAIQDDGSVLGGTAARDYEAPRTLLAQGRAAYLIDGSHAAPRGASTVPDRIPDIAVAPVPMPWADEEGRAALDRLAGVDVPLGSRLRDMGSRVTVITAGASSAAERTAAWTWMNFGRTRERQLDAIINHRQLPTTRDVADWLYASADPEATALRGRLAPFQPEVWRAVELGRPWPIDPGHGPVAGLPEPASILHRAFLGAEGRSLGPEGMQAVLNEVGSGLAAFTEAINRDLDARLASGAVDAGAYAIPDWDPRDPEAGFRYQREHRRAGEGERVAALRERLPASLRTPPPPGGARGWIHAAAIAMILAGLAGGYLLWWWWRSLSATAEERAWLRRSIVQNRHVWLFAGPGIVLASIFVFYPAISLLWLSLFTGTGQGSLVWAGTAQYARLAGDGTFWGQVLPTTLAYMVVVAGLELVLGLGLAMLLSLPLRGQAGYRTLMFVPMVTSLAVVAVIAQGLLAGRDSALNLGLAAIGLPVLDGAGLPIDWLHSDERFLGLPIPLWSVMSVAIWSGLPGVTILCMAGLQSVPADLYEAAKVDGAGPWTRFRRITVPAMLPVLAIILFNSLVGAARHFGTVYVLTEGEGGTDIAATYIYKWGFKRTDAQVPDLGYAATLGVAYMAILAIAAGANMAVAVRRWRAKLGAA